MRASKADSGNLSSHGVLAVGSHLYLLPFLPLEQKTPPAPRRILTGSSCCRLNRIAEVLALAGSIHGLRFGSRRAQTFWRRGFRGRTQPSRAVLVVSPDLREKINDEEDTCSSCDRCSSRRDRGCGSGTR